VIGRLAADLSSGSSTDALAEEVPRLALLRSSRLRKWPMLRPTARHGQARKAHGRSTEDRHLFPNVPDALSRRARICATSL
jgi:hypothetical protein